MEEFLKCKIVLEDENEKYEPKKSPYYTRLKKEKEVQNVPLHPLLLPDRDSNPN
jgi:hypothetical protein